MQTLSRELRRSLENTVRKARRIAEGGARKVIQQLAVDNHEPWSSMTLEQRALRNALRAHGRQLGDHRDERRGVQAIDRLTTECAYEHWHRMLFARFLAETNLLIEPKSGMDITLEDCQELARERGEDWLELASLFAERMLPEIFRTSDPVLKVALPPETRSELESLLKALSRDVFVADDSLGWVYQYWQADRKDEVNRSEKKIGADELPAVTQLFTEDYMVFFLLHNTLGAWWAGKVLAANPELARAAKTEDELRAACAVGGVEWTYLRFVRSSPSPHAGEGGGEGEQGPWRPAASTFDGWPKAARHITLLDPCMGSGHFLVFALPIFAALRATEEGMSPEAAIEAVLRDNLFGLEIDPRCTQIAAFNLALAAWRAVGHRPLPRPHLACSGLSLGVSKAEWEKLAERAAASSSVPPERDLLGTKDNLFSARIKTGLERLYDLFEQAPVLGSLINPRGVRGDVFAADFAQLEPLVSELLAATHTDELAEMAVAAQGMAKAAEILARQFTLVATNVPYLGIRKQDDVLRNYCERIHNAARHDLATVFLERIVDYTADSGTVAVVSPQTWLLIQSYKAFRERLLRDETWRLLTLLGSGAFETISGEVVKVGLFVLHHKRPSSDAGFLGIDASSEGTAQAKAAYLMSANGLVVQQSRQLSNPDSRVIIEASRSSATLSDYTECLAGVQNGDSPRFLRFFWEITAHGDRWAFQQSAVMRSEEYGGLDQVIDYDVDEGHLRADADWRRAALHDSDQRGKPFWGKRGVAVSRMAHLPCSLYLGSLYDQASAVIVPKESKHLPAIWAFCSSTEYAEAVRKLDQKLNVTSATLIKVPFDLDRWQSIADTKYPKGLLKPYATSPTQWLFNGQPKGAEHPLASAVLRLVGYRWPRQTGSSFLGCPTLGPDGLEKHADPDGIVCLTPLRGDPPAADRMIALLSAAFGSEWSAARLASLLAEAGFEGKSLDDWLRDGFFMQHCEFFQWRPFVWHIWDGRRDGFHALVNYHRLSEPKGKGKRTLETLIYTYLGDWIDRQRADQRANIDGADGRLAAAERLKGELEKILVGEPPYDIFVRWKPLADQAIGWEPDVNDGVRMNIRPFMSAKPLGAKGKGACILRVTPKIKWDKDRGKEPQRPREDFPWFWKWDETTENFEGTKTFDGNRWNDLHYSCSFKEAARAGSKK